MKTLVTGGAGFIGSHVAEHLLAAGHQVIVADNYSGGSHLNIPTGASIYPTDITDHHAVESLFGVFKPDYVYHLAAYAAEGLSHFIRRYNYMNNLVGSANLINECVRHDVKHFVFTSSIAVYGATPPPMDEGMTPRPIDPYGIAKYAVELDLAAAYDMFGLEYTIFRPHNVYGPRQNIADKYRNVIGIFMRQLMNGEPMTIFGDGTQTRAFSYIDDVAPLIAAAPWTRCTGGEVFNVGADTPYSVNHLAYMTADILEKPPLIKYFPERNEVHDAHCSHEKVRDVFGERQPIALKDGLQRMAAWALAQKHAPTKRFADIEIHKYLPPSWE